MNSDLPKLIAARPFAPFTIHLADGGSVRVPTRAIVHEDNGDYDILSGLLMARMIVEAPPASGSAAENTLSHS